MNNLLKQLQNLFVENSKWNYYGFHALTNPFVAPEIDNSRKFVELFLEYSNKTDRIIDDLRLSDPTRFLHIVTNYFIGILLYEENEKIRSAIDTQIRKITPSEDVSIDNSFKYFWFLICFYHDVGYCYENNNNDTIKSLKTINSDLRIKSRLKKLLGVPKIFQNIGLKYLTYRLRCFGVFDHGIVGGMLVYDRLIKIFRHYQKTYGNMKKSFDYKNLRWSESMFPYFRLIASVIFTHNIWLKNVNVDPKSEINLYMYYGLDKLVITNSRRTISLYRHPMLFLLGFVDSIEPTKRYGIKFLQKIELKFSKKDTLIITHNCNNDNDVKTWFNHISSLSNWLGIKTAIQDNSHIEIII